MKKATAILLVLVSFCFFGLSGCFINRENPYPYRGEYKELYTTAVYSIPNAVGYMHHGEGAYDSDIYIWEQDDYGRTLFSYCEDYGNQVFGLVLCQTFDEANVYFYPDINYVLTFIESEHLYEGAKDDHLKNKTEDFYLENRDQLKDRNDWNEPIDKSKCVSYLITDHKTFGQDTYSLTENQCNEILNAYTQTLNFINPDTDSYRYSSILQVDAEGRVLHEIHGSHNYYDKLEWNKWDPYGKDFTSYDMILWVITDKEGNYDKENGVMVMYSKANESDKTFIYDADAILEFKRMNGWKN
jgi:hypothetical protein